MQNGAASAPDDSICIPNDTVECGDMPGTQNESSDTPSDAVAVGNGMLGLLDSMKDGVGYVRNDTIAAQNDTTGTQSPDVLIPGSPLKNAYPSDLARDGRYEDHVHTQASEGPGALPPGRMRRSSGPHKLFAILHAILRVFHATPSACKGLAMLPGCSSYSSSASARVLTGTLFGQRKGHVHFAVQDDPGAPPLLLLELATPTNTLVKEMASGLVRIALECERTQNRGRLILEQVWTMFCNGRKTGYAIRRACSEADLQVFRLVKAVSMGAGVLPMTEEGPDGELMYMRAKFERVVGSRDSEAFYMMNPDGSGGPELSIFLLRI